MSDRQQELFNLMSQEHGLTLLESEMHDIEHVVLRMDQWQPIATAPKDGTRIFAYEPGLPEEDDNYWVLFWDHDKWTDPYEEYETYHPTHWQPLPEGPKG